LGLVDGGAVDGAHKADRTIRVEGKVEFANLEVLVDLNSAPHAQQVALLARGLAVVDSVLAAGLALLAALALAGDRVALGKLDSMALLSAVRQGLRALAGNALGVGGVGPVATVVGLRLVTADRGAVVKSHVTLARHASLGGIVAHKVQ